MGGFSTRPLKQDWKPGGGTNVPALCRHINQVSRLINNMRGVNGTSVRVGRERIDIEAKGNVADDRPYDFILTDEGEAILVPGSASHPAASGPADVVPTLGGTALNDATPPTLTWLTGGGDDGTHYTYLGVEIDTDILAVAGTWKVYHYKPGDSLPADIGFVAGTPDTNAEYFCLLNSWEVSGTDVSAVTNYKRTSLVLQVCDHEKPSGVWSGFRGLN